MQALIIKKTAKNDIDMVLDRVEVPAVRDDDVLIKVVVAGISPGSMNLAKLGQCHVPGVVGHLMAGTVAQIGKNVTNVAIGDRVRVHPIISCGKCRHCQNKEDQFCDNGSIIGLARFCRDSEMYNTYHHGGAAEYAKGPYWLIDKIPETVSFEAACKIHDAATASSVLKRANLNKASVVMITAPTGTIGVLMIRMAHLYGIKKLILVGRSRDRLEAVRKLSQVATEIFAFDGKDGGARAVNGLSQPPLAAQISALAGEDIDAIVDLIPSGDMLSKILPALKTRGTMLHLGGNTGVMGLPLVVMMQKGWTVHGTRSHSREEARECLKWVAEKKLVMDDLITHRFPLKEVEKGLEAMSTRDEPTWLNIIDVCPVAA